MDLSDSIFQHSIDGRLKQESQARRTAQRRTTRRTGRQRQRVEQLEREVIELAGVLQVVLKRLEEKGLLEQAELAELAEVATVELAAEQGVRLTRRRKRAR